MPAVGRRKDETARLPGDRLRYGVFLVAVLLIVAGTIFASQALRALIDTGEVRDHAQAAINLANQLMLALHRSELAARNYARSGETSHLETYRATSEVVPGDLAELRRLTAGEAAEQQRLDEIEPLIAESLAIIAVFAQSPSPEFFNPALFNAQIRRRDALAEQIDGKIGEFVDAENERYLDRRKAADDNARLSELAVLGSTIVSALALCAVLYFMAVEIRRRRSAETELASLNLQLEDRVRAQTADLGQALQTLLRETTVRQEAELRLRKLQRELVRASRLTAIGQIGAMLAHEINQPLTAITNYLHGARSMLASGRPEAAARVPEILQRTEQQAMRAGLVVQRLRDYIGRRETHQAAESLPEMIEDARTLAAGALGTDISLRVDLDPAARIVVVDRTQILQVLVNLMRNAIEAMAGSARRELIISTTLRAEGMVEVAIADSGSGLPAEIHAQLFTPFVSTKPDGLGIGLSICQSIVEAHGGKIGAEARPGGGTTFRFTLHGESPRTPLSDPGDQTARTA